MAACRKTESWSNTSCIEDDAGQVFSSTAFNCQYVCSREFNPETFALLTQCSTTKPNEHDGEKGKRVA